MSSTTATGGDRAHRSRLANALPWLWLSLSAVWAVVIFATDHLAWPLALWIATTVGPLTALKTRLDSPAGPREGGAPTDPSPEPTKGTKR